MNFIIVTDEKSKVNYFHCYVMFLWGVAVLELDSYPDHNKSPKPTHLVQVQKPIPFIHTNHK